jgi:hypothetical protein
MVLEQARAAELVAQLRAGHTLMDYDQVVKELDRIAAYVSRELGKLGTGSRFTMTLSTP